MTEPTVAALVLNYNGKDLTLDTVASLLAMTYPACEVVVVDNASTDGSYEAVKEAFPDVTQVQVEVNQGPASGMNAGLRYVLEQGFDYALLLNNDIEVDAEMVTEMVRVAESDEKIGVVGPKAYYYWDRERIWSAGGILRFKESVTKERGDGEIDNGQWDQDEEVDYICGCAMLVRRSAIEATGLWDTTYTLGVEDADWCARMKQQGYTCWYAYRARLWHKVGQSVGVYKPGRTFHTGRNMAIFVRKYAGPWQWLTFALFYTASIPIAFLRELPKGNQMAAIMKLKGVLEGLRVPMGSPPAL